jgi:MFS family permease
MPMAQTATSVFLVLALQSLWGFTPTAAGAISALMAGCWSLSAIGIASIHGAAMRTKLIVIGPGLLVAGLLAALFALQIGNLALLILGQIAIGAAFGLSWGPLSQLLMEAAPAARRDHTSALLPTLQSAGYAIGAAVLGLAANVSGLAQSSDNDSLRQAMAVVFVLATILAIASFLAALRLMRLVRTAR